jgi:hypothetical protein
MPLSAYGGLGEPVAPFCRNGKQGGGVFSPGHSRARSDFAAGGCALERQKGHQQGHFHL